MRYASDHVPLPVTMPLLPDLVIPDVVCSLCLHLLQFADMHRADLGIGIDANTCIQPINLCCQMWTLPACIIACIDHSPRGTLGSCRLADMIMQALHEHLNRVFV